MSKLILSAVAFAVAFILAVLVLAFEVAMAMVGAFVTLWVLRFLISLFGYTVLAGQAMATAVFFGTIFILVLRRIAKAVKK